MVWTETRRMITRIESAIRTAHSIAKIATVVQPTGVSEAKNCASVADIGEVTVRPVWLESGPVRQLSCFFYIHGGLAASQPANRLSVLENRALVACTCDEEVQTAREMNDPAWW